MGNHEYCVDCGMNDFHHGKPCLPEHVAKHLNISVEEAQKLPQCQPTPTVEPTWTPHSEFVTIGPFPKDDDPLMGLDLFRVPGFVLLLEKLGVATGVPIRSIQINMAVDEAVTVKVEHLVHVDNAGKPYLSSQWEKPYVS